MANLHLQPWTEQRKLLDEEHKGRSSRVTAGSHIADLVHLRKAVLLCFKCKSKFNAAKVGYVTRSSIPYAVARCDGCKEHGDERRLYMHHQHLPR